MAIGRRSGVLGEWPLTALRGVRTDGFARVWKETWHLGLTAFGGPPVHFKIFHDKFVEKLGWIDEQMYQELFAISQAFPGPASTKMLYCINLINAGFLPAVFGFLLWSLPGACGMYGFSVGVSHIGESLPGAVYALLSGVNAATVGIIALAAVQLSENTISDKLTRLLVFMGAAAGLLYNALWYFPLLMFAAGCVAVVFDFRVLHGPVLWVAGLGRRRKPPVLEESIEMGNREDAQNSGVRREVSQVETIQGEQKTTAIAAPASGAHRATASDLPTNSTDVPNERDSPRVIPEERRLNMSWKEGTVIISLFFVAFIIFMVLRGTLPNPSRLYRLLANMILAGTIIFGGGPVVIPLLREYVVAEGWVSPRDFLLGLAIIQAFPGPNFNFAVYLGSLTAIGGSHLSVWGALLGYFGIFAPGLVLVHGGMGLWTALRGKRWVKSVLRGMNAAAVGLIYTAVYRLCQIGYIDTGFQSGASLTKDPWWVVVIATSYVGGYWFGVNPPTAIVIGGVMGLIRYGVVST